MSSRVFTRRTSFPPSLLLPVLSLKLGRRSWLLLALLFGIGLLNYLDRQTLSILKATIKGEFSLTDTHYSYLVTAFMGPYILFYVIRDRLRHRFGPRVSLVAFTVVWSGASALSGLAHNFAQLAGARALLG